MIISKFFKCPKALPLFSYKNEKKKERGRGGTKTTSILRNKEFEYYAKTLLLFSKKEEKNLKRGGGYENIYVVN